MKNNKDRSRLFLMIQEKIKKRAKTYFEEEHAKQICDYADFLIKETEDGVKPKLSEIEKSLLNLKELKITFEQAIITNFKLIPLAFAAVIIAGVGVWILSILI